MTLAVGPPHLRRASRRISRSARIIEIPRDTGLIVDLAALPERSA